MGELADAIREHLELKRRRGADPAEVAREERDALAPVTRSHPVVVAADLEDHEPEPIEEREREVAPPLDPARNGSAPRMFDQASLQPDPEQGDATQEFHIGHGDPLADDWLDEGR